MIKTLDICGSVIESLDRGDLTEDELLRYFHNNAALLNNSIESAYVRYGTRSLPELAKNNLSRCFESKEIILSNKTKFSTVSEQVIDKVKAAFTVIPEMHLVPCLGLFSANGWAQEVDQKRYICLALEITHEHMEIILAHEIAHGLGKEIYRTILNGFYNEGFATYVSSFLIPGYSEGAYLLYGQDWYLGCLNWIDANRSKILEDSARAFQVLDEHHLYYFGSSNVNHPRVGYAIGYEYLKFLGEKYTLDELRTFGEGENQNTDEFKQFILGLKP